MSKSNLTDDAIIIANGVEYHVWREVNTFITWGHMMTKEPIRYTESNVITYRDMLYNLNYTNRQIVLDPVGDQEVPDKLITILKQVADTASANKPGMPPTRH